MNPALKITVAADQPLQHETEALIVGHFQDSDLLKDVKLIDDALGNPVMKAIEKKHFNGELLETFHITTLGRLPADQIVVVGLGPKDKFTLEHLRKVAAEGVKRARAGGAKSASLALVDFPLEVARQQQAYTVTEGVVLGLYRFLTYKTQDLDKVRHLEEVTLLCREPQQAEPDVRKAESICQHTLYARELINNPPNVVNPQFLAEEAQKITEEYDSVTAEILTPKEMREKKMGAILAVGGGSVNEPRMIKLDYKPSNPASATTVAVVGKGITFDSGGLDLKPAKYMENMKHDMSGAATVLATMRAVAQLNLPLRVIGIAACAENMPSGTSYRPDDIVTAMNGKTIEMLNTDAEGRMVLSDALSWASELGVDTIVDVATLTGACSVALGDNAAGLLSKDEALSQALEQAGKETYERVWPLPFFDEYMENMKSEIADVRNIGKNGGAGTINGAVFLSHFVKEGISWAHLDIANVSFRQEPRGYLPSGATGFGVRLFVNFLQSLS